MKFVQKRNTPKARSTWGQAHCAAKLSTRGLSPCAASQIDLKPNWDKRHRVKVSLCQDLYYFGIWDTLHLVPSIPQGDERMGRKHAALSCLGYFPNEATHNGDIPAVSAARHVMNVPLCSVSSWGQRSRAGLSSDR